MPKTIRNEFDKCLKYDNLLKAHNLSQKGKTLKNEIVLFNLRKEEYLNLLYEELRTGTYEHGKYKSVYTPQKRKIETARYIDKIVHRWVVDNFLEKYFVSEFIYTSYSGIKGRGIKAAVLDVQNAMKYCKKKWDNYYIVKVNIADFFNYVDKRILLDILKRKIKDQKLWDLINKIIYSTDGEKGLPIGNYTSQVFANIYLNEVDQYAKHELKCKYYFRYMDDTAILLKTKEEAVEVLEKIRKFLKEKLELELNSKTQIFKNKQGVNFCGYKINEYRLKVRDRGKRNLKNKVRYLQNQIKKGNMSTETAYRYLCGHIGYIKIADTKNLKEKYFVI